MASITVEVQDILVTIVEETIECTLVENEPIDVTITEEVLIVPFVEEHLDVSVVEEVIIVESGLNQGVAGPPGPMGPPSNVPGPPGECPADCVGAGGIEVGEFGKPTTLVDYVVFNGTTEQVIIDGAIAYINRPEYAYSSFNTTDGTLPCVPNISGLGNWYVSAPSTEGSPFSIGDWTPGTSKPCTSNTFTLYHSNKARKLNLTTFSCEIYGADDTTLIASHSIDLSGNQASTLNGITLSASNWEADFDQFAANLTVSVDCSVVLGGSSGRMRAKMIVGTTEYFPPALFYDNNNSICDIASTPTIDETPGQAVTRFLSGVEMYYLNSKFSVLLSDITTPNGDCYRGSHMVEITGSEFGLSQLNLTPGNLTGWTTAYDISHVSYSNTLWSITQSNYFRIDTNANISARGRDPWSAQSYVNSVNHSIIINTYGTSSTATQENYQDEIWRLPAGPYDAPLGTTSSTWQNQWDSSAPLSSNDLQCWYSSGWRLYYPRTNYIGYNPNPTAQPDYSGAGGRRYHYRAFYHNTTNSVQGSIRLVGVASSGVDTSSGLGLRVEFKIPGKTGWLDLGSGYNNGTYTGVDGDGIRQNQSSQNNDWFDFGWKAAHALDSSCGWVVVVRVSVQDISTSLPTSISMQWDVQEHA